MNSVNLGSSSPDFALIGNFGWKYYNQVKSKAMEPEFSWSGLAISLSIAFFVVLATAQGLNLAYNSINDNRKSQPTQDKVYYLESASRTERIKVA